jgi:M6 family metalloprotease-like protein
MRIFLQFSIISLLLISKSFANYYTNLPYTITQPNGEIIQCFVSGDEYFNWLHDKEGYTIIQAADGYYYYAKTTNENVIPTTYKVNKIEPSVVGLQKWAKISPQKYQIIRSSFTASYGAIAPAPHNGTLNNIVVYIRFSDDSEFTSTRQSFDDKFNINPGISMKSYFNEVSYSQFNVSSTHYPACALSTNYSYQDSHTRGYFQPYNATTNPLGYTGGDDGEMRTSREHTLLKDAINWINANSPVSETLNLDGDGDSYVDNVCFITKGGNGAWASLLWAHSWSLYSYNVSINGKRVMKFTFQPETMVDVQTLCHEMFHAVGAPDLYHYTSNGISPVSDWDLMQSGFGHMGAYMKWKYSNNTWINSIPEISTSGTYTLNPLTSSSNNCYKIASPNSTSEFFVVEYRKKISETFEYNLPGSGLIVYRIDPTLEGNADGPPDEVYIYRPNGTTSNNGSPLSAFFSSESGRTSINDGTNPSSFLQNGSSGGLNISNVTSAGNTISFSIVLTTIATPTNFTATPVSTTQINLQWQKNGSNDNTMLIYNTSPTFGTPVNGSSYSIGNSIPGGGTVIASGSGTTFNHTGLQPATTYYYKIVSVASGNNYSSGVYSETATFCNTISSFPHNEGFENGGSIPACWTQEQVNNSNLNWTFVLGNGASNPSNAHSGSLNACLKDASTSANITRLISPKIDFSYKTNTVLTFWHTQEFWSPDQDSLSVYYKTSSGGSWILLANYTNSITSWTQETIALPNPSSDYYICFEGNAKWGHGVCIDDVSITAVNSVPANQALFFISLGDNDYDCWNALENITVAGPTYSVELFDGSEANFVAGESINFLPGFHAYDGSQMRAFITTTGDYCNTLTPSPAGAAPQAKSEVLAENTKLVNTGKQDRMVKVYPNPNNGRFVVELSNFEGTSEITVTNTLGAVMSRSTVMADKTEFELSMLQKGLYFITIKNGNSVTSRKIVVQ